MGVNINSLGLVITGPVRRVHDAEKNKTTIDLNREQCEEAFEALGAVLKFFNEQDDDGQAPAKAEPQLPLG